MNKFDIKEPLILISQIQRCGGTLLNQLLDGHPEIYCKPLELSLGGTKQTYPDLYISNKWKKSFLKLKERWIDIHIKTYHGYNEDPKHKMPIPFNISTERILENFKVITNTKKFESRRDIMNAYFTSYFNAWKNYKNIKGKKKYISVFAPLMSMSESSMKRFFRDYPDGKLISLIRDPRNWYASSKDWYGHSKKYWANEYTQLNEGMKLWEESAISMIKNKKQFGDKVYLLSFENLVTNTKKEMITLAAYLDIEYNDILLTPTFNGTNITPNTYFKDTGSEGINKAPLERYKLLDESTLEYIQENSNDVYNDVLDIVNNQKWNL